MSRERKFVADNLSLMEEWNWTKNDELEIKPDKVSYGSALKVWWICKEGHEWEDSPNHRSGGRGCPICGHKNRYISKTKNWIEQKGSLESINPELVLEWHPIKNGELLPRQITVSNGKKVWWLCKNGHEWQAQVKSRSNGAGCPICSGHQVLVGYNDLATVNPPLALEWHPTKNGHLTPKDVTKSNGKKVWWLCKEGHEWETQISNRTNGGGCPICSGKKVLIGYNDLLTKYPLIASEWHPTKNGDLTPADVTLGSNKKVWWMCNKGHEWKTEVAHRTSGRRCPICYGESQTSFPEQAIYYYFNKLTTTYNRYKFDKNTEIDIYLPELNIGIEYDGAYFHKGKVSIERENRKDEILKNSGITLIRVKEIETSKDNNENIIYTKIYKNDDELTNTIKYLIMYINNITGLLFEVDIDIKRDRNEIYNQYINLEKERSLLAINPNIATEWHPTKNGKLLPEHVTPSSNKKVWWICKEGHEWEAVINSRNKGIGCPYCVGKKAIVGYNDLATVNPRLASEWHPTKNGNLTPYDVTESSNKFVWWMCSNGHEYKSMVYDRKNGCNCPICSGHKVLIGYNDLATVNPKLASEWHPTKNGDLTPQHVTAGSRKKVWWLCTNGHEWHAQICSRKEGYGCPYCAGQRVLVGVNDLATISPRLASEWHPTKNGDLNPTDVMAGSNKKVWWICKEGHEWEAVTSSRKAGRGCPICYKNSRSKKID